MRKVRGKTRATAWLLSLMMVIGAFFGIKQNALAANEGTLNLHKLAKNPVTAAEKENGRFYTQKPGSSADEWYEYLDGAEYTIYKIGTFTQTTDPVKMKYEPVSGLKKTDGTAITVLDKDTKPNTIDTTGLTVVDTKTTNGADDGVNTSGVTTFSSGLNLNEVYLVKETKTPAGVSSAENFIITVPMYNESSKKWDDTINAYPKNAENTGSIKKEMTTTGLVTTPGGEQTVNKGAILDYKITVGVPDDITSDKSKYKRFNIVDESSKALSVQGLTMGSGTTVASVDGTFTVVVTHKDSSTTTLTLGGANKYEMTYDKSGSKNVLTISFFDASENPIFQLQPEDEITVTYKMKVDPSADGNNAAIANNAYVDYKADDNEEEIPPIVTPTIYSYSYGLQKIDDDELDPKPLAGAKFVLVVYLDGSGNKVAAGSGTENYLKQESNGDWSYTTNLNEAYTVETKTDDASKAIRSFDGLEYSEFYYIRETEAPDGYIMLKDDIQVTINQASTDDRNNTTTGYSKQVVNTKFVGGGLPETGGNGIYLYIFLGLALIGTAFVIYIRSRKNNPTV